VVQLPISPIETLPPVGTVPFQSRFFAVTIEPLWLQAADQPWVSF
jgi:hypothetical protein